MLIPRFHLEDTVKTTMKEHVFWGFRVILFLHIGCFLQNQPENVLKVFLKLFLNKILHRLPTDEINVQAQHFNYS